MVTGAKGFLGKHVCQELRDKGYSNIIECANNNSSNPYYIQPNSLVNHCDLRNKDSVRALIQYNKPDVIIHLAARVGGIGANQENPATFIHDNLTMGINLIEESKDLVGKFVLAGTVCSYPKYCPIPFEEKNIWSGYPEETNAPYGIAKKTLMRLVEAYNEQYGFNGVNLIPVNMYGPHDHFNLTSSHVIPALILKFYNAMQEGDSSVTLWGTGQASREFLFAPDCAEAIKLAIEKDVSPEPINIGTGQEIKICELATEIAEQMGYGGKIIYDTSKPDGQPRRCLDTTRAKDRLGFEAKTNFKDGLKQTIEWFLGEQQ